MNPRVEDLINSWLQRLDGDAPCVEIREADCPELVTLEREIVAALYCWRIRFTLERVGGELVLHLFA